MTHFIFQDGLHSSYWIVECDIYASQDSVLDCDNADIASFRNFSLLSTRVCLRLAQQDTYKVIEDYSSLLNLPLDTTLLAV